MGIIIRSLLTRVFVLGVIITAGFYYRLCAGEPLSHSQTGELFLLFAASLLSATGILVFFTIRRIHLVRKTINEMARGNLDVEWPRVFQDEIGLCVTSLETMRSFWSSVLDRILPISVDIEGISKDLKEAASATRDESVEQTNRAHDSSAATKQMSVTISDNARFASELSEISSHAMEEASGGQGKMKRVVDAMDSMSGRTKNLSSMVQKLNGSMGQIDQVVVLIKNIADQTNLLALNAAIEAARAGGAGGRFAVVSGEVRNLAERTIESTEEIAAIMNDLIEESKKTDELMQDAVSQNDRTKEEVESLSRVFQGIIESFKKVNQEVTDISASIEEQSVSAQEISDNLERSLTGVQMIRDRATGVDDSVTKLIAVTEQLRESTMGLKSRGSRLLILDLARTDHRIFVQKVADHLDESLHLEAGDITDHHNCRFGKWYYSDGQQEVGELASFRDIEKPHEEIHRVAREIVSVSNSGKEEEAKSMMDRLNSLSSAIQTRLETLKEDYRKKLDR